MRRLKPHHAPLRGCPRRGLRVDPDCPLALAPSVAAAIEHLQSTEGYPAGSSWMGPHTAEGYWKERLEAGHGEYGPSKTQAAMQWTLDKEKR